MSSGVSSPNQGPRECRGHSDSALHPIPRPLTTRPGLAGSCRDRVPPVRLRGDAIHEISRSGPQ
jgi:hypothetical protein